MADAGTLLLLHGFSNTHRCWERLLGTGVGEGVQVLAPDLRGHGAASGVRPVDLAGVLDDLGGLVSGPCTLVGYSQGGRIALHAALDRRIGPWIRRLVLIGASPGLADPHERAARRRADEALAEELEHMSITDFAERWARVPVLAGVAPDLAEEAHADRLRNSPAGLAAALRGLGTGTLPPLWDRLGELGMPMVMIVGERDAKFRAVAEQMVNRCPAARVMVVPGAGHQVHLEAPEAVAAAVRVPAESCDPEPGSGSP